MSKVNKFTIIGAGSSYTPELIDGFIKNQKEFQIDRLFLYDIDLERLDIVGGMVARQLQYADLPTQVIKTENRPEAVEGADYIVSQIRVGQMPARVLDEKIPLKYNVIGQETTGPGGTFKAWRTIPASLDIAQDVMRYAPDAWFLNFTNPSGIITEALAKHTNLKVIGLCDNPINAQVTIAMALKVEKSRIFLKWMGMNHVNWIAQVLLDGVDITSRVMDMIEDRVHDRLNYRFPVDTELIRALGVIPNFYLQYYYHHPRIVEKLKAESQTRGEVVIGLEKILYQKYADPNLFVKPPELSKRGGAMYSQAVMPLIISIHNDRRDIQAVVTQNNGAISDFPDDSVVEVPCTIGKYGAIPLSIGALPQTIRGLAQQVKTWENLTVDAGVTGSRKLALAALMTNPQIPSLEVARQVFNEMLSAHCAYLPQFMGE
jgi:6-phospho-beta-glucosidase